MYMAHQEETSFSSASARMLPTKGDRRSDRFSTCALGRRRVRKGGFHYPSTVLLGDPTFPVSAVAFIRTFSPSLICAEANERADLLAWQSLASNPQLHMRLRTHLTTY